MSAFDTSYEFTGYVIPGAVLLLGLMFLYPWTTENLGDTQFSKVGAFIIVTFVLGHLLHGLGHLALDNKLFCEGGMIYRKDFVINDHNHHILSDSEPKRLTLAVRDHFGIEMDKLSESEWCNTAIRIRIAVRSAKQNDLLDVLARDYGFYLGVTGAFTILGAAVAILPNWRLRSPRIVDNEGGVRSMDATLLFVIIGLVALLTVWRLLYFGRLYTRELLLSFLSLPHPGVIGD